MATEAWLRGPIAGVPALLQPVAHALVQAREDVAATIPPVSPADLWAGEGAATAGFHVLHAAGALDRLFTYARGEALNEAQRAALKAEAHTHPDLDGPALEARFAAAVEQALAQLAATDSATLLDERLVGRARLPSTVLGLLFHGAEHATRHVGQLITTLKLRGSDLFSTV